jgi:hypothetical protein
MNRENLQKMADHIRTIPQEVFAMNYYRSNTTIDQRDTECNSVGCVIGHSITLAPNMVVRYPDQSIDFEEWSEEFTGIESSNNEWDWLFSSGWHGVDNSPEGAALRIEWFLKNGLPEDWNEQMQGEAPLCYIPQTKNPTSK